MTTKKGIIKELNEINDILQVHKKCIDEIVEREEKLEEELVVLNKLNKVGKPELSKNKEKNNATSKEKTISISRRDV